MSVKLPTPHKQLLKQLGLDIAAISTLLAPNVEMYVQIPKTQTWLYRGQPLTSITITHYDFKFWYGVYQTYDYEYATFPRLEFGERLEIFIHTPISVFELDVD